MQNKIELEASKILSPKHTIIDDIRNCVYYNPDDGIFTWINTKSNRMKNGDIAGHINKRGYLEIYVCGKPYLGHRLAWFYMTGEMPKNQIDHKDTDKSNNRWNNLREADNSKNHANTNNQINNTSGYKGVGFDKRRGLWYAKLVVNYEIKWLGYFSEKENAAKIYKENIEKYFGEFARANQQ